MKFLMLFPLLMFLGGCAYPKRTELYAPKKAREASALVYVYRSRTNYDSANPDVPRLLVNGEAIGKLPIGGYYETSVLPGEIQVATRDSLFLIPFPWNSHTVSFKAIEGQKLFVKFSVEGLYRATTFEVVPAEQGEHEISECRLLVY